MSRTLLIALMLVCVGSFCFAQQPAVPARTAPKIAVENKALIGKVDSVTPADPVNGGKSEIAVIDDSGNKSAFSVKSTTTIYDANWEAISLDKINKDDSVKVKYITTKDGVNEAVSINIKK